MAKKGGSYKLPGLRQALAAVDTLGKQMGAERMGDYGVALSASNAGQANLRKQTRALTRDLLSSSLKQQAGLNKLARQAKAQRGAVKAEQGRVTNRYGAALGQQVAQDYRVAAATAAGTAAVVGGAAKAGRKTTGVAETVAGIATAGVAAQKAAAQYSLNQALQQRTIIDNQTLASLSGDLYKTALSYNMQMAMYERQRQDALRDQRKAAEDQTRQSLEFLNNSTPEISSWLQTGLDTHGKTSDNSWYNEDGTIDISKVRDAYAQEMGIDPTTIAPGSQDAIRLDVLTAIAREMKNGSDISTATEDALNTLYSGMPGWEKLSGSTVQSIVTGIGAQQERQALGNLNTIGSLTVTNSPGLVYDLQGYGNPTDNPLQYRDAAATHILDTYGSATAKAWLRGQTNWSDPAIDTYLSTLHAGVSTTEAFSFQEGS